MGCTWVGAHLPSGPPGPPLGPASCLPSVDGRWLGRQGTRHSARARSGRCSLPTGVRVLAEKHAMCAKATNCAQLRAGGPGRPPGEPPRKNTKTPGEGGREEKVHATQSQFSAKSNNIDKLLAEETRGRENTDGTREKGAPLQTLRPWGGRTAGGQCPPPPVALATQAKWTKPPGHKPTQGTGTT